MAKQNKKEKKVKTKKPRESRPRVKTKDLNFLDHIRIGVKLIIGFITITLLVVFMAFFGIKNFNDLNTQLEITDMVMDSLVALEAARTNQVKYEIEPDSETASEVYANLSDAKLTALKAQKLMKSEVNKSNVDQLLAAINTFQLNFNRFEDLEDTKADDKATTEEATLNFITAIEQALSREGDYIASLTTADQIESSFNKYVHMTELKDEFFGIYVLTTQYSSTPTDDIENQIDNSISQMRADYETLIATLNDQDTKEYLAIANQQLDTFEEAFNSYESSVGQQEDLRAILNESASEASDIADEIDAGVQAYIVDLQASVLGFSNIITLLAIAISIILTFFITRSITKPINNAINIITDIASYDLIKPVPATLINRRDEFGKLGQAMETIVNSLKEIVSSIQVSANTLLDASTTLATTASETSNAAEDVAQSIDAIAKGASEQASSTEQGAFRVSELGDLIENDRQQVNEMYGEADVVNTIKDEGLVIVKTLVDETKRNRETTEVIASIIDETSVSAQKIEQASQMIQSIADQTNLLALNAAIEAARAGDAGRGFAVVAEEIRKLAEQSANFTNDIQSVITELISKSNTAVDNMGQAKLIMTSQFDAVQKTDDKFKSIADSINSMKKSIDAILVSSQEMDAKKNDIIEIMESLSAISEENAASTQQSSASIEEQTAALMMVSESSNALTDLAKEMETIVSKFRV